MPSGQKPRSGQDIPDLAAPARSARPGPQRTASGQSAAVRTSRGPNSGPMEYFGSGTFDLDPLGDGSSSPLALDPRDAHDEVSSSRRRPATSPISGDSFESTKTSAESLARRDPVRDAGPAWPTGSSPDPASLDVDPLEVGITSDYGPAPTNLALAPAYAVRVFFRRRELRTQIAELGTSFEVAEKARDELLVALAEDVRAKAANDEELAKLFAGVSAVEEVARTRKANLVGVSAEYDELSAKLEEERAAIDGSASENAKILESARATLAERRRVLDRAEARKKRAYIEIRGILDLVEKSGGGPSDAQSAKLDELERAVAAQKPELDLAAATVAETEATLRDVENGERELGKQTRELDRQRRALDARFKKQLGVRTGGVNDAEKDRALSLADAARKVLALRGRGADVPKATLDRIAQGDRIVLERALELEKHVRARSAYDADAFKRGIVIAAGAALLVVLFLSVALFRHGGQHAGSPQPTTEKADKP